MPRSRLVSAARILAVMLVLCLAVLAYALSHDGAPPPTPALAPGAVSMRALVHRQYGSPAVLRLERIARPTPAADQLLIHVQAAALNPLDWHYMRGTPYLVRLQAGLGHPRNIGVGVDFAGTVEAIGPRTSHFKIGDEIFGTADGSVAEYAVSTEVGLARKPDNLTFEQAAAVPVAAFTALQGLRDHGQVQPGQKVLINGASGGVGTFAVQLAKIFGAEVTAVCSTRNVELVRSIGADHVIDYTHDDLMQSGERYDVIFDAVGNPGLLAVRRVLKPHGILVLVGAQSDGRWLGGLVRPLAALLVSPFVSQRYAFFIANSSRTSDIEWLRDQLQAGKLKPVIDRQYALSEGAEAMRYLEAGHAHGKVVIAVQ
jgi:NADPH:quinone reductase-like Zn-dependent oxidoreductase